MPEWVFYRRLRVCKIEVVVLQLETFVFSRTPHF